MTNLIPFTEISESQDRSWSFRLVELLREGHELSQAQLDDIASTLAALDDQRVLTALSEILFDESLTHNVRLAASDALSNSTTYETSKEREQWWQSGDDILQRHAVRKAEKEEEALITTIASNPAHPLYGEAIDTLAFWFEPRFQKLITEALNHKDREIREIAARSLLWEQPVEAELRLLEIAAEPDEEAALAALDTLNYCASKTIFLTLADLITSTIDEEMKAEYKHTFRMVSEEFTGYLVDYPWDSEAAKIYFENWANPVIEHLRKKNASDEERAKSENADLVEGNELRCQSRTIKTNDFELDVDKIIKDLSEDDGKWYQKSDRYYRIEKFEQFNPSDRDRLLDFLIAHNDPLVREIAVPACRLWQRSDGMLRLLKDPVFTIRKQSAYNCGFLPADERLAEELLLILNDKNTGGSMAREALDSYLVHSPTKDHRDLLLALALNDERPAVRNTAVNQLSSTDARTQIEQLLPILLEPPCNTWQLHMNVIDAFHALNIEIPQSHFNHLLEVVNLALQATLAEVIGRKYAQNSNA